MMHQADLGQLEGQGHRALLPPGAVGGHINAVDEQSEVIAMRADDGHPSGNLLTANVLKRAAKGVR